jgi:hypothetical protein
MHEWYTCGSTPQCAAYLLGSGVMILLNAELGHRTSARGQQV